MRGKAHADNEGNSDMARYIICPRCELNFIDADEQEYCEVCVKEMSGERTFADGVDNEDNIEETELCPICGENYMVLGEKMCEECKKKSEYEEEEVEDEDKEDASWRSYLDDEEEELDLGIPDSEFDEEEEEEEEEEEIEEEVDDFEYVSADDYIGDDDDDDDDDDDFDSFDDDDAPTPRSGKKRKRDDDDF